MVQGRAWGIQAKRVVQTTIVSALIAGIPRPVDAQTPPPSGTQNLPAVVVAAPAEQKKPKPVVKRAVAPPRVAAVAAVKRRPAPTPARPRAPTPTAPVEASRAAPVSPVGLPQTLGTNSTIGAPPPAYAGGQVARGGQVGLLGNKDFLSTPFTENSYTDKLIRDQQARTVSDVVNNDSSVRTTEPEFGI